MLIGATILIVLGVGFYLYKLTTVTEFEEKVEIAAYELKSKQLDNYVSLCLRQVMDDGVTRLSQQGSYVNEPPNPFELDGWRTNIAMPKFLFLGTPEHPEYPLPPDYPQKTFSIFTNTLYPFSNKSLPFLCQKGGPNDVRITEYARPCPFGSYGETSIQKDLSLYAAFHLKQCVDASLLQEISGFAVEAQDPQVIVTFGETSVLAQAKFPIIFKAEGEQTTKYFDFSEEIPVRLKKIFGLVEYLINNDRYYLSFRINESFLTPQWRTEFYDNNMNVARSCPKCGPPGGSFSAYTELINITDKLSTIDGKSVSFFFAISPRYPVLDWIHQSNVRMYDIDWDYVVVEGSTITIEAKGDDPDEDTIRFEFSGWKKDYGEKWDITIPGCEDMALDAGKNPFECMVKRPFCPPAVENRIGISDNTAQIKTNFEYMDAGSGCNLEGFDADLGAHTVWVNVTDEHGMKDWQNVTILVIGEPEAKAALGCYFPDASGLCKKDDGTLIASLEDPIVLDASGSVGLLGEGSGFVWSFPGNSDSITVTDPISTHPRDTDILDIYTSVFLTTGVHDIILALEGMEDISNEIEVDIKECLPYRKDDISLVPPYPYNRTDPFLSAHACCKANFELEGISKKCFEEKTYGTFFTFDDAKYRHAATALTTWPITWEGTSEPPTVESNLANDIFERKFARYCDGTRGNICSGVAAEARTLIGTGDCNDFDKPGQDERCQGPPTVIPAIGAILCEDYAPGITFEKKYTVDDRFGNPANGTCLEIPEPSSGNGETYNSSGPYYCVAQCDGDGQCRYAANCACQNVDNPAGGDSQCNGLQASLFAPGSEGARQTIGTTRYFCNSECRTVEPDSNGASCQWVVRGTLPAIPNLYNSVRPADKRCCGDDSSEFLTTTSGRTACCSEANSCVMPDGSCLGNNQISTDGQYYCYSNDLKTCNPTNECKYYGSNYCNGAQWVAFTPPRTTTNDLLCATGDDVTIFYCGQCQASMCTAKPEFCPPEQPVCSRVGAQYRCQSS